MSIEPTPSIRLHVAGSGRPLVLLHALPVTRKLFDNIRPPEGRALVLADYPGFGGTSVPETPLTFTDLSRGLQKSLQETFGDVPIVIGGVSMGGYWAMEFIRLYPGSVEKALFIATRANAESDESRRKRLELATKIEVLPIGQLPKPNLLGNTTIMTKPEVVSLFEREVASVDPKAVAYANRCIGNRRDQKETLKSLTVPAIWMAAGEDPVVTLDEARSFAALSGKIDLIEFPKSGHLIPWEEKDAFQAALDGFLKG